MSILLAVAGLVFHDETEEFARCAWVKYHSARFPIVTNTANGLCKGHAEENLFD